jgi:hypothetical protein
MRTVKIHTGSGWEEAQLGTREEIKALGFKYGDNLGFCRLEGKGWNHALLFCGKTPTGVKWYAADSEMVAFLILNILSEQETTATK